MTSHENCPSSGLFQRHNLFTFVHLLAQCDAGGLIPLLDSPLFELETLIFSVRCSRMKTVYLMLFLKGQ
jgi:hypothetical protein